MGHSCTTANFIPRRKEKDSGELKESEWSFTIANARYKKDNTEIIKNTYGELLNNDLKVSVQSKQATIDSKGNVTIRASVQAATQVKIDVFIAADNFFYSMALGKPDMSGWWCTCCKLK